MNRTGIRAGDRAFVKVGRNLVEVRVAGKAEGGWSVTSRTGKAMTAKTLLTAEGEALVAHEADAPSPSKATKASAPKAAAAKAATAKPAAARAAAEPSAKAVPRKGLSLLNAAAAVLERSDAPMSVRAMIAEAKSEGLWTPGAGKTPEQTLYSAIIREIKDKGEAARFRKDGRGLFAFAR